MDFISNQEPQIKEMLAAIGISDVEALFRDIPQNLRLERPQKDDGLSEFEGIKLVINFFRCCSIVVLHSA